MKPELFNPHIQQLINPHYPSDIPKHVTRLHLMENPYPLPEAVQSAIHEKLRDLPLNRYPDITLSSLKQKLHQTFLIPSDTEIILGNGSFELLQSTFIAMHNSNQCFLTPSPSFFFFQRCSKIFDQKIIGVPPQEDMLAAIEKHQPSLVIIDNPNNPMGTIYNEDTLEKIIHRAPGFVLIDEAYFHYASVTMMSYLKKHPNLLVLRSLSKAGLAGIRLGYLCCHPDIANHINKVTLPFNINMYTATAAEVALDHFSTIEEQVQRIIEDREHLLKEMQTVLGDNVSPSNTNFINFKPPNCNAKTAFNEFLKHDILLFFYRTKPSHPLANYLRITVGTRKENKKFLTEEPLAKLHQSSRRQSSCLTNAVIF